MSSVPLLKNIKLRPLHNVGEGATMSKNDLIETIKEYSEGTLRLATGLSFSDLDNLSTDTLQKAIWTMDNYCEACAMGF